MKKHIFTLITFVFFTLSFSKLFSQTGIVVEIVSFEIVPPYTNQFADYARADKLIMTLRNGSRTAKSIKFKGSLKGQNTNTLIKLSDDRSGQIPVLLAPNATKTLNFGEIKGLFESNGVWEYNIPQSTFQSLNNSLPSDDYTFCLQVVDAQTGDPLSENPSNCSNCCPMFTVESVEPPYLQSPLNEAAVPLTRQPSNEPIMFQWTPSSGSFVPTKIEYVLEIVEAGQNANQAFLMGNVLVSKVIAGTQSLYMYKATDPPLEKTKTYAWRVRVQEKPTAGRKAGYNFQNEGKSEVYTFIYGETTAAKSDETTVTATSTKSNDDPIVTGDCKCKFDKPKNNTEKVLAVGDKFYIGGTNGFEVLVNDISNGKGTGTLAFSLIGFSPVKRSPGNHIPLRVTFQDIKINTDNVLIAGAVASEKGNGQPSLMPAANTSNLSKMPDFDLLNSSLLTNGTDMSKHWANIAKRAKEEAIKRASGVYNSLGMSTPLGISQNIEGIDLTVAFDNFVFSPTVGSYDAMTVVEDKSIPIAIPLGIKGACLSLEESCPERNLYLVKDAPIGSTGLVLKGGSDFTKATHVVFNTKASEGFQAINIVAEYEFSESLIKTLDGNGKVKATMTVMGQKNFSNWTADVKIPAFKISGQEDFEFGLRGAPITAFYDHSLNKNPIGLDLMVNDLKEVDQSKLTPLKTNEWKGFFMPKLAVVLPEVFKTGNDRVQMQVENLVIDGDLGLTGSLKAQNVFAIGNGNLDGWYYSLDNIGITFFNGSLIKGSANGKLILPISGNPGSNATQLDYTNTLSRQGVNGDLAYQFVIQPKDDVNVPIWKANINLAQTSNISVSVGVAAVNSGKLGAIANLDGKITFKTPEIAGGLVPSYDLRLMEFNKLRMQSFEPYFIFDDLTFLGSFASPKHSVAGAPFSIDEFKPVVKVGSPLVIGFYLKGTISLADIPCAPSASLGINILANADYKNGRPNFSFKGVEVEDIAVEGELGPVHVAGSLKVFSDDSKFGDGFKGRLAANVGKGALKIEGQAVFGKKDFSYWYLYLAVSTQAPMIQIGPVSINGFGGGIYHNMIPPVPDKNYFAAISDKNYNYTPNRGTDGLKASVFMSVATQYVFKAKVSLEGNMTNGVLSQIILEGNGQVINDGGDKGLLNAIVRASYDFPNKVFRLDAGVSGGMTAIKVDGQINILSDFNKEKYYLKIGEPTKRQRITLAGGFADVTGYFMVGNAEIPDIPEPSSDIMSKETIEAFKSVGYRGFGTAPSDMPTAFESSEGLAFGATLKVGTRVDFLIFFAELHAGAGFDVNIRHYKDATCEETGNSIGANGWYAKGQAYFEVRGAVGVRTFWDDVKIVELKAAALLGAGLPNPTYFQGFVHGEGTFLGATLGFTLPLKIGERCTIKSNPFKMPLIADYLPKETNKVDIIANPEIFLNYPRKFDVSYENANGEMKSHSYELKPVIKIKKGGNSEIVVSDLNSFSFPEEKNIIYNSKVAMDPLSSYKITFGVNAWEDGRVFTDPKSKKPVRQDTIMTFKTGPCPTVIPEHYIGFTFPFKNQKHYMPGENSESTIALCKEIPCLFDPAFDYKVVFKIGDNPNKKQGSLYQGSSDKKPSNNTADASKYTKVENMAANKMVMGANYNIKLDKDKFNPEMVFALKSFEKSNEVEVPVRFSGNKILYTMPKLPINTYVEVKFVKLVSKAFMDNVRKNEKYSAQNKYVGNVYNASQVGMDISKDSETNKKLVSYNTKNAVSLTRNTNSKSFEAQAIPLVMYSYGFRTSKFNTFADKMNSISQTTTAILRDDLAIDILYNSEESFDHHDVIAQDFKDSDGKTKKLQALINVKETDNKWETNRIEKDLYLKTNFITTKMLNVGMLSRDDWRNTILSLGPAEDLEIVPSTYLQIFSTRPSDILEYRMPNNQGFVQFLVNKGHEMHRKISEYHGSDANSCCWGACVCSQWETIKDNWNKNPYWRLAHDTWDYRNRDTGNFHNKCMEIIRYDLMKDYKNALPLTPTLNFTYQDPLSHKAYVTKRYTLFR